jgi:Xaa-Pro aminopeptidase
LNPTLLTMPTKPATTLPLTATLATLRTLLAQHSAHVLLVPSVDEHLNEYLSPRSERRKWVSGFDGSAGDALIDLTQAWLFVDSRYHEQADQQVDTSLYQVHKLGLPKVATLTEQLEALAKATPNFTVAFDPFTLPAQTADTLATKLAVFGAKLLPTPNNWVDDVCQTTLEALPPSSNPIVALPVRYTGNTIAHKLQQVREALDKQGATGLPLTKLDQIAWLFNLRGSDIPYNPMFTAYAWIDHQQALLFCDSHRLTPEAMASLQADGVTVLPYDQYVATLKAKAMLPNTVVLLDADHQTAGTVTALGAVKLIKGRSPVYTLKSVKNPTEIKWITTANAKASRAKTRLLAWLATQQQHPEIAAILTEASVARQMEAFYAEEADFVSLSFNTISGAGANSSIVHYGTPDPKRQLNVAQGELLLLDSGAQYTGGTTDDTRTVWVGPRPTGADGLRYKERYTAVLQAHIAVAMQHFPAGTDGAQLDGITRSSLWQQGLDFGHGTGHGVGAFLSVHEGPNGIHKRAQTPFVAGMVTSIEPGFYQPGWGGIRLENLALTSKLNSNKAQDSGHWFYFKPLTWIPFDRKLILPLRLTPAQRVWLNRYHAQVFKTHQATLSPSERSWLRKVTLAI